jgi:hypothetical protein
MACRSTNRTIICLAAASMMLVPAQGAEARSQKAESQAAQNQAQKQRGPGPLELRELPRGGADGFVTIIGGDNLKIWKGLPNYWYSRGGVLGGHETKENSKQTFLVLPFRLRDFELRLKYRFLTPEGNSGIQFRSRMLDPETCRVGGYQADIDATGKFDGSLYDEAGVAGGRATLSDRGARTTWNAENQRSATRFADTQELLKVVHIGDWNEVKLVARGNHITYSINDRVMTELIDESPNAVRDGFLALQLHEGFTMDVQFKDGKVRKLD